jgi:8-oxo-dGTP diphosphatase/2-hydroxy-dATP diphosphatase
MRNVSLLFLIKKTDEQISDICLAMKKRGFGAGRWNGVGGKPDEGETIEETTIREAREEIGITAKNIYKVAELDFTFPHNELWCQTVNTYFTEEWDGEPEESEEMLPKWYKISEIPFSEMWPDDIFWLPKVIDGEKIKGKFTFGEGDTILEQKLESVESFDIKSEYKIGKF